MNIILGASGQVGSAVVERLQSAGLPVRAVVHKAGEDAAAVVADLLDAAALKEAFRGGTTAFVITPETGHSNDVIGETKEVLQNYRQAVEASSTRKIVGLSSMGAQHAIGNLEMSYLLERAFEGLRAECLFIRPAFYYSNWLRYLPAAKEGTLPTWNPLDLKIPMISPLDVASFAADAIANQRALRGIVEVEGPRWYSSREVADAFAEKLGHSVVAQEIPREQWPVELLKIGFTEDATSRFIEMTDAVRAGIATAEGGAAVQRKMNTSLPEYLGQKAVTQ